jgi:hypothetical protein
MFPISKGGYSYSFTETGLQVSCPDSRDLSFPFSQALKLRHSTWTGALSLKGPGGSVPLSPLSTEERQALVLEFFRRWKSVSPESAKKAAFDYLDGQKGFVAVAFTVSLLFCLPLSVALLSDSWEQLSCTRVLQQESVVGEMEVVKAKKKRKNHYILDLEFVAPDGSVQRGKDQLLTEDESAVPKTVPVVYSPKNPACWSLTPNFEGTEPNWARRRFFGAFTLLFGAFFLGSALLGTSWSLGRWLRPRPFRKEISEIFQL